MTDEEYSLTQQNLLIVAGFVKDMPLDAFLSRISNCESIAPILDPTLYIKGATKLQQIKRLAQSLQPFQREIQNLQVKIVR